MAQAITALGLMSGTSMDGIDAAILFTDGEDRVDRGPSLSVPYPEALRRRLLALSPTDPDLNSCEEEVTDLQISAVRQLCAAAAMHSSALECIGFHGQTILHDPKARRTWQLGDGARMARALGCKVINRFRDNDLRQGGQGAPLVPAYHRAIVRAAGLPEPIAVLNIGGVSNLTWIHGEVILAWDCGPGNALIDDWMRGRYGRDYDDDGTIAARGVVDQTVLRTLMLNRYFATQGPKSLDRNAFSSEPAHHLSGPDGAATLTAFTAEAVASAAATLPAPPLQWIVVGGGRRNPTLIYALRDRLQAPVLTAEERGWDGDMVEAQAFAYLAVRSLRSLPLTWPTTTGVKEPTCGGQIWCP